MIRYIDDIIIIMCLLSLIGCGSFPERNKAYVPPLPANLAQPCAKVDVIPEAKASAIYDWVVKANYTNVSCATLHQSTVDFYNLVREANNGL